MNKTKSFLVFILLFGILFSAPLSRAFASNPSLTLTSSPSGATVYINNLKQTKLTPCTFKNAVAGTRYALLFNKVGYVPQTIQSTATTTNTNVSVVLKKVLVLNITSSPSGATVYINNVKQAQLTPCQITSYASGTVLNLRLSKPGYLPFSKTFSTPLEGPSNISEKLLILPFPPVPVASAISSAAGLVPAIQYASSTLPESKTFAWTYDKIDYTWSVAAPASLLTFDRSQTAINATFYSSNSYSIQQSILSTASPLLQTMIQENMAGPNFANFVAWTQEPTNVAYVGQLARALDMAAKASGYDYFHEAEFILTFVQTAIPYVQTFMPELPTQTLFDAGDCKDKSILYTSLLEALGYRVAFFYFPNSDAVNGHEAVGVAFTTQQLPSAVLAPPTNYPQNGENYYFAETAAPGWLLGEPSYPQIPLIYPVN